MALGHERTFWPLSRHACSSLGWRGRALAVILVLNQYKCIGRSPGKHPDTRTMATGSNDDSRDSVHDRCLGRARTGPIVDTNDREITM